MPRRTVLTAIVVLAAIFTLLVGFDSVTSTFGLNVPGLKSVVSSRLYMVVIAIGALSTAILWFWMVFDFLARRPESNPVMWGICLLLLGPIAALAYFWEVYRPRSTRVVAG